MASRDPPCPLGDFPSSLDQGTVLMENPDSVMEVAQLSLRLSEFGYSLLQNIRGRSGASTVTEEQFSLSLGPQPVWVIRNSFQSRNLKKVEKQLYPDSVIGSLLSFESHCQFEKCIAWMYIFAVLDMNIHCDCL